MNIAMFDYRKLVKFRGTDLLLLCGRDIVWNYIDVLVSLEGQVQGQPDCDGCDCYKYTKCPRIVLTDPVIPRYMMHKQVMIL